MPEFDFMSSSHVQVEMSIDEPTSSAWTIAATDVTKSKGAAAIDDR
jgi:hypothetical protein